MRLLPWFGGGAARAAVGLLERQLRCCQTLHTSVEMMVVVVEHGAACTMSVK